MKIKILASIAIASLITSCTDLDKDATTYINNVSVQLIAPSGTNGVDLSGHNVVLTSSGRTLNAATDNNGLATFSSVIPDVYTISTSWNITNAEYLAYTGDNAGGLGAVISGNVSSNPITQDENISLQTNISANRDLVIGKIYYNGSKDANNRNYTVIRGSYLELYNQSADTVNAAGLYIALMESNSTPWWSLTNLHSIYNDSVVAAKQIFRIPTGNDVLIAPGGSLLIANSAINHITVGNAPYENDLTGADFEAKDSIGRTYVNNPDVPAITKVYSAYSAITYMNFGPTGPNSIVIFRTNENVNTWQKAYPYGSTTSQYQTIMIPVRFITDGVDFLPYNSSLGGPDPTRKRLYTNIDATYTSIGTTGSYNQIRLYRKTAKTENGRKVLQDTNNSQNDFKTSTTIGIREYDE